MNKTLSDLVNQISRKKVTIYMRAGETKMPPVTSKIQNWGILSLSSKLSFKVTTSSDLESCDKVSSVGVCGLNY